jgi:hypothetical protein
MAMIRNVKGMFVAGSCPYLEHVESAALVEALAMLNRLELAASFGCNMVQAESDAIEVINACHGENMW